MTYNGSERKHIRKAEKLAAQADIKRRLYTRQIMSTVDGREWMHTFLTKCHIFHTPFASGHMDVTAFNCGEQNLGLQLLADVTTIAPQEYVLMQYEASQKEALDDRYDSDDRSTNASAERTGTEPISGRNDSGSVDEPDDYGAEDGDVYH